MAERDTPFTFGIWSLAVLMLIFVLFGLAMSDYTPTVFQEADHVESLGDFTDFAMIMIHVFFGLACLGALFGLIGVFARGWKRVIGLLGLLANVYLILIYVAEVLGVEILKL